MGKKVSPKFSGYLYQWTKYKEDFFDIQNLQRKGGNSAAAKRFELINRSLLDEDTKPRWLICARVKNGRWIVDAICKLRLPSEYEREVHEKEIKERKRVSEKYLYLDEDNSFLLANPNEKGFYDSQLHALLDNCIKKNSDQLEGANGLEMQIYDYCIERLKREQIMKIADRVRQLRQPEAGFEGNQSLRSSTVSAEDKESNAENNRISNEDLLISIANDAKTSPDLDAVTRKIDEECAGLEGKDVDAVVKRRVGQGVFRDLLLEWFDGACCMTGLRNPRVLIASHIVPWSKSLPTQKLSPENGLLLSVAMDALFDKGLISFSGNGSILIKKDLEVETIKILGLERNFALPEKLLTNERKQNLAEHRRLHGFDV